MEELGGTAINLQRKEIETTQRANAFSQRVVDDWNDLPESCVTSDNINKFKDNLNETWKRHPYKFDFKKSHSPRAKL